MRRCARRPCTTPQREAAAAEAARFITRPMHLFFSRFVRSHICSITEANTYRLEERKSALDSSQRAASNALKSVQCSVVFGRHDSPERRKTEFLFKPSTGTSACSSCETVLVMKRDKNMTIPWQRGGDWKPILRLFFAPTPFAVCLLSSEGCFAPPCPLCRANFCFVVSSPEKLRQKGGPFWRAAISLSNPLAIRGSFHGSRLPQEVIPAFLNRLS